MLETWRDSWFEEGSRLIYIVPDSFVAKILPLTIDPKPAMVHRVFVGRVELVTPATQRAIETAVVANDRSTLGKYSRFLAPMIETMLRENPGSAHRTELNQTLKDIWGPYFAPNLAQNAAR